MSNQMPILFTFYCSSIKDLELEGHYDVGEHLHSTVVLLKRELTVTSEAGGSRFTFYCSSIKDHSYHTFLHPIKKIYILL